MKRIRKKFLTDIDNVLSKFHVEIIGLPENHYSVVSSSIILTNDIFQQIVDMFKELIKEEVGDFDSFASLIDVLLQDAADNGSVLGRTGTLKTRRRSRI